MLVKVTDELWLESRNVKLVRIAERTRGQGLYYIVWTDVQCLGEFQTKAEAQEFAQSVVDKLNNATRKEIKIPQFVEANTYDCGGAEARA